MYGQSKLQLGFKLRQAFRSCQQLKPCFIYFVKSITKEIKYSLYVPKTLPSITTSTIIALRDDIIIQSYPCFSSLLIPRRVDNDVPSEDEDLYAGMRYMYGELVESIQNRQNFMKDGEEERNRQRDYMLLKEKCLNDKDKDKDKENRNCNNLTDFAEPLSKNGARKTAYSSQRKKIQKIASKHSRHRLMISKLPKYFHYLTPNK